MANVLEALIYASERAACVARSCAASLGDETLVVAEKCGDEANSRFDHDFKTIADVLAQEAAKVEISHHCENLAGSVWGEECGEINGHSITLGADVNETATLLSHIVSKELALKLSEGSHCDLNPKLIGELPYDLPVIDVATLGVWIDPIEIPKLFALGKVFKLDGQTISERRQDWHGLEPPQPDQNGSPLKSHMSSSGPIYAEKKKKKKVFKVNAAHLFTDATAEFIAGVKNKNQTDDESGLSCVTVLIGAFVKATGEPVMGVVNQPFYNNGKGRILWGASYSGYGKMGGCEIPSCDNNNTVLVSGSESPELIEKFRSSGWEVKPARGCGNKLMKVALGEAAAYLVTKGTTFYWDTCAPHAVLKAKGGDILSFATLTPVTYIANPNKEKAHCNSDGIIAYSKQKVLYGIKSVVNKT